jgi:chaperonin GroEL (HSP60 family)
MTPKQLVFRNDAHAKILAGINTLALAVRGTPGPKARTVVLERPFGAPLIINSGVVVTNAGAEPSVSVNRFIEGTGNFGCNALTNEYDDMVAMGLLDPCKVTRSALQNAGDMSM